METKTVRFEMLLRPSVADKLRQLAQDAETSKAEVVARLIESVHQEPPEGVSE